MTPPESEGATPGVTRAILIEIAEEIAVAVRAEPVAASALTGAPILLTNSLIGVAGAGLGASDAQQPALASRLAALYEQRVDSELSGRAA